MKPTRYPYAGYLLAAAVVLILLCGQGAPLEWLR